MMERERATEGSLGGRGGEQLGLIHVKRERESDTGQQQNCSGKRHKVQENGRCCCWIEADFSETKTEAAIVMDSPPPFRVESPAHWSIGIRARAGGGGPVAGGEEQEREREQELHGQELLVFSSGFRSLHQCTAEEEAEEQQQKLVSREDSVLAASRAFNSTPNKSDCFSGRLQLQDVRASATVTPFCSAKNVRNMWIHRFSSKGVTKPRPAIGGEVARAGATTACRASSSRQAIPPQHSSQNLRSNFHNSAKQESAVTIPQTKSSVDTEIKACRNITSNSSGAHLECNLSTAAAAAVAGGLVLGTLDSSVHQSSVHEAADGYGDLPNKPSTIDDTSAMSAVKTWRTETAKYTWENMSRRCSGKWMGVPRCWFCGLPGHSVANCSETLNCELQELEKWATEGAAKMRLGGNILCLRCLGIGHWGAQCHLSVIEAASKAHEKAEFWRLNKANGFGSCREQEEQEAEEQEEAEAEQQMKILTRTRDVRDYTSQDTEGVVCFNCNEMGHWARYCPRRRGSSDGGGQSSGSGKGHQISNAGPGGKAQTPLGEGKSEAFVHLPSSGKPTQSAQARRYCSHTGFQRRPQLDGAIIHSYKVEELSLRNPLPPPVPNGMLAAVELVRLSRLDLQKWVNSPDLGTRVKGFFLRLRFGRWEAQLGGTGYRMARIKGAVKKSAVEQTIVISVDLGATEYNVDSQYVSNQAFTEGELAEWWRRAWMKGEAVVMESELQSKLNERQRWPVTL